MFSRQISQKLPSALLAHATGLARATARTPKFCRINVPRVLGRQLSCTPRRQDAHGKAAPYTHPPPPPLDGTAPAPAQPRVAFETQEPRLSITFTCTVPDCGTRSTHEFTKRSYQKGIVIVQCPGCESRHLIADHLGWFKESTEEGKLKTVEDLMRAKGESVKRGRIGEGGVIEHAPEES